MFCCLLNLMINYQDNSTAVQESGVAALFIALLKPVGGTCLNDLNDMRV